MPTVTRIIIENQIKGMLGRSAEIEILMLNPYSLSMTIKGLHITEQDSSTDFITIDDLYVNIQSISALKFAPVVKELRIEGPFIKAVRYTEDRFSFSDIINLLEKDTTEGDYSLEKMASLAGAFRFKVQNISITDGGAAIIDQHMNKSHRLRDLNISIPLLSNLTDMETSAEIELDAVFNNSQLLLNCNSRPFSETKESIVGLSMKDIDLPLYYDYVPMDYDIKLVTGQMDMEVNILFKLSDNYEPDVFVSGNMALENLSVIDGSGNPIADIRNLNIDISPSDIMNRNIHIKKIELNSSKVEITRDDKGKINLYSMFFMPTGGNTDTGVTALESGVMEHGNVVIDTIDMNDSIVYFSDNYKASGRNAHVKYELLKTPHIYIKGAVVDMAKSEVDIDEVDITGGACNITRLGSGELIIEPLTDFGSAEDANKGAAQGVAFWNVGIKDLHVERFSVHGLNLAPGSDDEIIIDNIKLKAEDLSTKQGEKSKINFSCKLNKTASIDAEGQCSVFPVEADMRIMLKDMNLAWAQPFFLDKSGIIISNGIFSTTGNAQAQFNNDMTEFRANYSGAASIDNFECVDEELGADLISWKGLNISGLETGLEPMYANVAQLTFDGLDSHATLNQDWTINFLNILDKVLDSFGYSMSETDDASGVAQEVVDAKVFNQMFPVNIGKFELKNGSVEFIDKSIVPNYVANISDINCIVNNLSTDVTTVAALTMDAKFDGNSTVNITGVTNPFKEEMLLDVNVQLDNMNMGPLSPYTGRYIGYDIEKGDLTVNLDYVIKGSLLDSINDLEIDRFTLGNRVESKEAIKAPFKLAISLLKDRKGLININMPVKGSIDDPEFKVGKIIFKTILKLVLKAATSPFSFIASVFGEEGYSKDDINHIEFKPGSTQFADHSNLKLETIEKALLDRPGINIEVAGYVDVKDDRLELIAKKLDKFIAIEENTGMNISRRDVNKISMEREKYIDLAFKATETGSYAFLDALYNESSIVIESEKIIIENFKVTDSELKIMAQERAEIVKNYLLRNKEIAVERVQVKESDSLMAEEVKDIDRSRVVLGVSG